MPRVLLHSLVFAPDSVSTAHLMTDLALELKRLGHSVTVLTATPHYNIDASALARQPLQRRWVGLLFYSELEGIPVWHVKLPFKGKRIWLRVLDYLRFHTLSLLASLCTVGKQDIVIATSPPLTIGVMSWLLGVRWRAPSIYKVAELYPDLAVRQGIVRNRVAIGLLNRLERFVYRRNSMIVPIAEQFRRTIKERGVPDAKLCMIPDFVDTEFFRPMAKDQAFLNQYGLSDRFIVLYGGNIGVVQDWESVLYAAEQVKDLPISFVLVGDGARRQWLDEEVSKRNLNNIKLLGYVPKEQMPQINANADLCIIPMTKTGIQGGFPSKVYTIMACGKALIASGDPDSEMAWIVKKARCGRVVLPEVPGAFADALKVAYIERATLAGEGESGRIFVQAYSKQAVAGQYAELIKRLVKN